MAEKGPLFYRALALLISNFPKQHVDNVLLNEFDHLQQDLMEGLESKKEFWSILKLYTAILSRSTLIHKDAQFYLNACPQFILKNPLFKELVTLNDSLSSLGSINWIGHLLLVTDSEMCAKEHMLNILAESDDWNNGAKIHLFEKTLKPALIKALQAKRSIHPNVMTAILHQLFGPMAQIVSFQGYDQIIYEYFLPFFKELSAVYDASHQGSGVYTTEFPFDMWISASKTATFSISVAETLLKLYLIVFHACFESENNLPSKFISTMTQIQNSIQLLLQHLSTRGKGNLSNVAALSLPLFVSYSEAIRSATSKLCENASSCSE